MPKRDEKTHNNATLKDIAAMVGMDASTVSRAINHPEKVKDETLQKIQKIIKEVNYYPNMVARGLQKAKSNLVALVVPNFTNLSFANITKGFHDVLQGTGYEPIICSSQENPKEEIEISHALLRQRVSGIVFVSSVSTSEDDIPFQLFKNQTQVLVIDRDVKLDYINVFLIDAYSGIKNALRHLLNLGHKQIGIITGFERSVQSKRRVALIRTILKELNIDMPERYFRRGDWSAAGGWYAMEDLLAMESRPTAVFAITDTMAFGAVGAACAHGLRVPQDISVIGFNNEPGSESFNPPLTTIGPQAYNIGLEAGKTILDLLEKGPMPKIVKTFPVDLIVRKSTAPPPADF